MIPLPPIPAGLSSDLARWLELLRRQLQQQRLVPGSLYGLDERPTGTRIDFNPGKGGKAPSVSSGVEWMVIKAVGGDFLTCRRISDGVDDYEPVVVLRPLHLSYSALNVESEWTALGLFDPPNTLSRGIPAMRQRGVTVDGTALSVDEMIWPPYVAEPVGAASPPFRSVILARKLPAGNPLYLKGDGTLAQSQTAAGADGYTLEYMDTNEVGGRNWVTRLFGYRLCQGRIVYIAPIYAGDAVEVVEEA